MFLQQNVKKKMFSTNPWFTNSLVVVDRCAWFYKIILKRIIERMYIVFMSVYYFTIIKLTFALVSLLMST